MTHDIHEECRDGNLELGPCSWEPAGKVMMAEGDRSTQRKRSWFMLCGLHATRDVEDKAIC